MGPTIQSFGTLTVLWSGFAKKSGKNKEEKLKYLKDDYPSTAKRAARNLTFVTILLKMNPCLNCPLLCKRNISMI